MKITLNGEVVELENSKSVLDLLKKEKFNHKTVAVIYNKESLNRDEYESTMLKEQDSLEVVKFIIGG